MIVKDEDDEDDEGDEDAVDDDDDADDEDDASDLQQCAFCRGETRVLSKHIVFYDGKLRHMGGRQAGSSKVCILSMRNACFAQIKSVHAVEAKRLF